jgi:CHAT domain-containing protein
MCIRVPCSARTGFECRPGVGIFLLCIACLLGTANFAPARAAQSPGAEDLIQSGIAARSRGNIQLSIDLLSKAWETPDAERARMHIAAELGASLLQARRLDDAEKFLQQAYKGATGAGRAKVAVDLGNLAFSRGNNELAQRYFDEAVKLAGNDLRARLPASLNRARLLPDAERRVALGALFGDITGIAEPAARARLYLNLGFQARQLVPEGLELAYRSVAEARKLVPQLDKRLALETFDALAQLYEDQDRRQEALRLTQSALEHANTGAASDEDILLRLEWRKGRIAQRDGRRRDALAAYQLAAHHLETIRQDLPIEYEDGRSSFRETLQPVLNGLVDLLLAGLDDVPEQQRATPLRAAINALELTRQSEMQDFLGDRCAVDGVRTDTPGTIPAHTAIIYPVLLPDRLELLMEADGVIVRRTVKVGGAQIAQRAKTFARALSRFNSDGYLPAARELYDWVLRPFEDEFTQRKTQTVVVVSDGPLRLIPFGALHDGKQFAIERFAFSTVTGMSMTSTLAPAKNQSGTLLAGMAVPGPVVDQLATAQTNTMLASNDNADDAPTQRGAPLIRSARLRALERGLGTSTSLAQRTQSLRESLSLPGVQQEMQELGAVMPNTSLVDQNFTLARFTKEISSGDYRIVHIASHGVFGGSASSSYIMTYDQVLTMDRLESLLRGKQAGAAPIELLTLSACETAEGNERAPLGISGAAIKAKAQSVIGTLWPVGDEAARKVMGTFYAGLVKKNYSKAEALQRAQKEVLADKALAHPFYWAPFALIGNWR